MPESGYRGVTSAVEDMTTVLGELSVAVGGVRRGQRRSMVVSGLLAVLLLAVLAIAYRMWDCTSPGGRCYRNGQERTGQAIAEIIRQVQRSNVISEECAVSAAGDRAAYRACVTAAGLPLPDPTRIAG